MQISEAIYGRRSIRVYNKNELVSDSHIEQIIEAGTWAPSACNNQGWRFIVINDEDLIHQIYERGAASFLKNVTQAIIVVYDNRTDNIEYTDHIQSASAAIQNMLIMAHALNVGTCWVCNLPPRRFLKKLLSIPWCYDPIALISLGYFNNELQKNVPRKNTYKELISYNVFDLSYKKDNIKNYIQRFIKRLIRYLYKVLPFNHILRKYASKYEKIFD